MKNSMEMLCFPTYNRESRDLLVYQCGREECTPSHSFGPAIRDHFLIHYIIEGSGTFLVNGKLYKLHKNQGFIIFPDDITYYEADNHTPWIYKWVGFKGIKAEYYLQCAGLTKENPIFEYSNGKFLEECFDNMIKASKLKYASELKLQGLLSIFLSELIELSSIDSSSDYYYKDVYIKKCLNYIEMNYSKKLLISEIAALLGLNTKYFSLIFKESIGVTPQQYIISFRVNKACELMKNFKLSICDISRSVGYDDSLAFSKIFKKQKGMSPKKYREQFINSNSENLD